MGFSLASINLWVWAALFGGCLVYDYVNAKYIKAVSNTDRFMAANTSMFLVVVGGLFTYEYVNNLWNLIPISLGCWAGIYFGVAPKSKIKRNERRGKNCII